MNIAILLAGGQGTRVGGDIPKQYCYVEGRPIIGYSLRTLAYDQRTDVVVVVAAPEWHTLISRAASHAGWKKVFFASPGETRQYSIYNALKFIESDPTFPTDTEDCTVLVHDAARPLVTTTLIARCYDACREADAVMPVVPVKDTIYYTADGQHITQLLDRSHLKAGQAPEAFRFGPYLKAHDDTPRQELLRINGSTEIAYRQGLNVVLVEGETLNFKITTPEDLCNFEDLQHRLEQNIP